ncbi:MAG: HAD hydrolase-like protein [Chloroflexi bacterium]|nr:HAD hydrolase-like protein [Chloroflexota bacterium]
MALRALIFDVDGTIADTERAGHLPASNQAIRALGYSFQWTWEEFKSLYHLPGTADRFRYALEHQETPPPPDEIDRLVREFGRIKQQVYIEEYLPQLPLRAGVEALMQSAVENEVQLAIVSTTYEAQIHALLDNQLAGHREYFWPVLGKETGTKTAPDSPLYRKCLEMLAFTPDEVLVIEDSEPGLRAALNAGLPCAVIYNGHTFGGDFRHAVLVARSLAPFSLHQLEALCLPE